MNEDAEETQALGSAANVPEQGGELEDELDSVVGGTNALGPRKQKLGATPGNEVADEAVTWTAIAMAESGGNTEPHTK